MLMDYLQIERVETVMRTKAISANITFDVVLGTFQQRLNRFMTLVEVNHEKVSAHLSNSGRLSTVLSSGTTVYLRKPPVNPKRRSRFDLFAVQHSGITTIVDAIFSNTLAETAFERELFEELAGYRVAKKNVKVNSANLDLMLEKNSNRFFLEVKSVTHVIDNVALFPDAPTARGRKHVQHLIKLSEEGLNTGILFSVQRPDAKILKPNYEVDPLFAELLREAAGKNVKILTLQSLFKPPNVIELESNAPVFSF